MFKLHRLFDCVSRCMSADDVPAGAFVNLQAGKGRQSWGCVSNLMLEEVALWLICSLTCKLQNEPRQGQDIEMLSWGCVCFLSVCANAWQRMANFSCSGGQQEGLPLKLKEFTNLACTGACQVWVQVPLADGQAGQQSIWRLWGCLPHALHGLLSLPGGTCSRGHLLTSHRHYAQMMGYLHSVLGMMYCSACSNEINICQSARYLMAGPCKQATGRSLLPSGLLPNSRAA